MNIGTYILMGKFPISMRMFSGKVSIAWGKTTSSVKLIDAIRSWSDGVQEYWSIECWSCGALDKRLETFTPFWVRVSGGSKYRISNLEHWLAYS